MVVLWVVLQPGGAACFHNKELPMMVMLLIVMMMQ
jgi:hypothetical protein